MKMKNISLDTVKPYIKTHVTILTSSSSNL